MNSISEPRSNQIIRSVEEPRLLHQLFERSARLRPDHTAVDVPPGIGRPERRVVTYRELDQQADAIASLLRNFVSGECVVAILLPRCSEHLYSSQLGVLKAGAAYACIDTSAPDEQLRDILENSEAVALLTDNEGMARAKRCGFDSERVFEVSRVISQGTTSIDAALVPPWLSSTSLAYIIYTSGTTGRPKGVMIEHAGIHNLVRADIEEFALTPEDRVAQSSSPAYDSSLEEIWLAFAAGAAVVVMDDDTVRMGPDLVPWLQRERITVLCPPPTLLRTTGCDDPEKALPELSLLYVGGEALPGDVAERWARGRRLVNGYGPTECTVTALRGRIIAGEAITIGYPVSGLQAWVLDESLNEVSDGQPGELCLGGVGLARGYRNRPELNDEKFPVHPRLGRIYRTGDLAHRDPDGRFFYNGRMDSQVKLRGYRIELEAIEARLAECEGVRAAACRVQQNGSQQMIVAFIVSDNGQDPRLFDILKAYLLKSLPAYMVPGRFAFLPKLPTTVGGKLNRNQLPNIESQYRDLKEQIVGPRTPMEARVETAFRKVLSLPAVDVHDDFFYDLGGDSLNAAELISLLRDEPSTASVTVRDLYEARSVAELAKLANAAELFEVEAAEELSDPGVHPVLATSVQSLWILIGLLVASTAAYFAAFEATPALVRNLRLIPFLFLSPVLLFSALLAYTPVAVLFAVLIKRLFIGRYRPLRAPVWGSFYVRNWIVQQTVRIVPWRLIQGTVFQHAALRALGARIGKRVHIHRGVNLLQGGWDLLEIGDDVTLSQDSAVRLVELEDGQIVIGPVTLGDGSTLDVRSGVSANTVMEPGAFLTALSSLASGDRIPGGEQWDGIPAKPAGRSPNVPGLPGGVKPISPLSHSILTILARFARWTLLLLSLEAPAIALAVFYDVGSDDLLRWMIDPSLTFTLLFAGVLMVILPAPLTVIIEALAVRAMGRVQAGVISRWSPSYVRVLLKTQIVQSAGQWLSGTIFWPMWLRLAGMKIGRGCEISTIIDVVPELIEIGDESFFADGIYLGGPRVHRGTVTLAPTRLGKNTFLGNHSVIQAGQALPDDLLIGVCTAADDTNVRAGTAWFGQPPFELPRRGVLQMDRRLTHEPSLIRYLDRVFWELLRNGLLVVPLLALPFWFRVLASAQPAVSLPVFHLVVVPLVTLGVVGFFCLLVVALKWGLLGRVRPGTHAFWSCWCSRWDFLYVAWGFYASTALSFFEGTLLLSWYLRAMGVKIGRRVVLGGGFSHVVDPDMLEFEDGATVSCQFQAHTFEDRVLKIDHVKIRRRATVGSTAVLLYGADIGARAHVAPHSVVMKRESLLPGRSYAGCPTHPVKTRRGTGVGA